MSTPELHPDRPRARRATRAFVAGALALAALLGAACAEPFSNEDLAFLKALPTREQVELTVPGTATSSAALRPAADPAPPARPARFYGDARMWSTSLNQIAFFVLDLVQAVERFPPTTRDGDTRQWGPFPGEGDDPAEYQMFVVRTATSAFAKTTSTSTRTAVSEYYGYALQGRRRGTSEWLTIFQGRYAPSAVLAEGMGQIAVSFEAVRALRGSDDHGFVYLTYDNRDAQQTIEMALDLTVDPEHPFAHVDAGYRFHAAASGDKQFVFGFEQNIEDLRPDTGPERFIVTARWLPDQRGRANVLVEGGDLGARQFYAVECWDQSFSETFLSGTVPDLGAYGALTDCAPELQSWLGD